VGGTAECSALAETQLIELDVLLQVEG
jgi:hypothetical protein